MPSAHSPFTRASIRYQDNFHMSASLPQDYTPKHRLLKERTSHHRCRRYLGRATALACAGLGATVICWAALSPNLKSLRRNRQCRRHARHLPMNRRRDLGTL